MVSRGNTSASRVPASARAKALARAGTLLFAAALASSGCTNNLLKSANQILSSGVTASNPFAGNNSGGSGSPLTLSRVVKDNTDPTGTLDLFDDGSGAMQQFCTAVQNGGGGQAAGGGAQGGNTGPTTCNCTFSYIRPDGTAESFDMPTTYHERDQIRCNYAGVPSTVPFLRVKIHLTNADVYSNEVTFQFTGTGVSLDLANPNSFAQVNRYQCRDIVFIPYIFSGVGANFYDPIMSQDPRYSYPLNFYTTNMGGTLAFYANNSLNPLVPNGGVQINGWDCPAIPNDSSAGLDLSLFSVVADSSGSKQIYPPVGVFDRSTFFLARQPAGVFSVPVNAIGAPQTPTSPPDPKTGIPAGGGLPSLGYGAVPIPSTGGGETCPDSSVTIPAGFHWVKVWLFRMDLPQRKFPSSTNLLGLNQLACNPGPFTQSPPAPPNDGPYPDCSGKPSLVNNGANLAARFSKGTGQCSIVTPGGTTNPASPTQQLPLTTGLSALVAPGTDVWQPANVDPNYGCTGTKTNDVAHTCPGDHIPNDQTPGQGSIDNLQVGPRYDFLYVVSPPSVNASDMMNTSNSVHLVYTPFRFMSPNDCMSSDPDAPSFPGDCNPSRMLRNYSLKLHDVATNGDPPAGTSRPGVFPVCALQPN